MYANILNTILNGVVGCLHKHPTFVIKKGGIRMEDDSLQKELEYQFEWFHRNPELSYEEYETTKKN